MSETFFITMESIITNFSVSANLTAPQITGALYADGFAGSQLWDIFVLCNGTQSGLCASLHFAQSLFVNGSESATWFAISLDFDPLEVQGGTWLNEARQALVSLLVHSLVCSCTR